MIILFICFLIIAANDAGSFNNSVAEQQVGVTTCLIIFHDKWSSKPLGFRTIRSMSCSCAISRISDLFERLLSNDMRILI